MVQPAASERIPSTYHLKELSVLDSFSLSASGDVLLSLIAFILMKVYPILYRCSAPLASEESCWLVPTAGDRAGTHLWNRWLRKSAKRPSE